MNKNSMPALLLIMSAVLLASQGSRPDPRDVFIEYPFPEIAGVFAGKPSEADGIAGLAAGMEDMIMADFAGDEPKLRFVASVSDLWASGAKILAGGGKLSVMYPGFSAAVDGPFRAVFPNDSAAEPLSRERKAKAAKLFRSLSIEVDKAR